MRTALLVFLCIGLSEAIASPSGGHYSQVQIFMRQLAALHPESTQLVSVGLSDSGQIIEGLRIGSGHIKNLIVATHHGNEYGSTEVAKAFALSAAGAESKTILCKLPLPG